MLNDGGHEMETEQIIGMDPRWAALNDGPMHPAPIDLRSGPGITPTDTESLPQPIMGPDLIHFPKGPGEEHLGQALPPTSHLESTLIVPDQHVGLNESAVASGDIQLPGPVTQLLHLLLEPKYHDQDLIR